MKHTNSILGNAELFRGYVRTSTPTIKLIIQPNGLNLSGRRDNFEVMVNPRQIVKNIFTTEYFRNS